MLELAGKFMLKTNSGTEKHQTVAAVSLVSDAASSPDLDLRLELWAVGRTGAAGLASFKKKKKSFLL